jgi:pimeloyl-ACP methyl ester carboxylesterase
MNTTSLAGTRRRGSFQRFMVMALLCMPPLLFSAETNAPAAKPPTPLGQLIDLGGYKMHLFCTGQGSPTVILSPGSGDFSFDWTLVQPRVAKLTRVCSYDRGGEAWSDLGPLPRTMTQEVFDLHRAFAKANIPGPYILVGHSSGGTVMRLFAASYPGDVVGMVLVDGSHEEDTGNINDSLRVVQGPVYSRYPHQCNLRRCSGRRCGEKDPGDGA